MRLFAKALLASATAAAATFALAPAHAELNAPRVAEVRFGDLDLATTDGKARLQRRIAYAAETVCGPADQSSYHSRMSVLGCQDQAIADAGRAMVSVFAANETAVRVAAN